MSWERRSKPTDASRRLLDSADWKGRIRNGFKASRLPCARCRRAIDYDGSYYIRGTRKKNPRYLHVGHIVERDKAIAMGWTDAQINHPSNLQPECADCSNKSGARYGRRKQGLTLIKEQWTLDNSRDW